MEMTTTITPKFQVHLPAKARKLAGIKKHGPARVYVEDGKIIIEPINSNFMSLKGLLDIKNPIPPGKLRNHIEYVADGRY